MTVKEEAGTGQASRSDFIRSQPVEMSVADVVAKGKEAGMTISPWTVYSVRSAQKKSKDPSKPRGRPKKQAQASKKKRVAAKGSPAQHSKSSFVRSLPITMPAAEVVAKAKAVGLGIDIGSVYTIRSVEKMRLKRQAKAAKHAASHIAVPAELAATHQHGGSSLEGQFVGMALDLGLARASELLEQVKAKVKAMVL